jgi:RNA polymerase sigma-70 factor (ECF subfamily)
MAATQDRAAVRHKKLIIDEAIFIRISENDMAAFEEFYHLTERSVYAFALSILRNHEDAMDVAQDTYIKIRGAAHLYQPMGKPMAWVFTIVRNLSMSKIRSRAHTEELGEEEPENNLSFSYVTDSDDRLILQSALKILNEEERKIILLHAISGYTYLEISRDIGLPLSTVLSKYHRGLKKLKKYLTESGVPR